MNNDIKSAREISVLAEYCQSDYSIILSEGASEAQRYAAEELCYFLKMITGAILPVVTNDTLCWDEDKTYISLGKTSLLTQAGIELDYSTLNGDGFFIKTAGKSLFINGYRDRGIIYGVYEFLESTTGLRFVAHDCTYIPKIGRLALLETNSVQVPAFEYRGIFTNMTFKQYTEKAYAVRMRYTFQYVDIPQKMGGKIGIFSPPDMNGVHNSLWWVNPGDPNDPESLCKRHPEVFVWDKTGSHPVDICWSKGIAEDGTIDHSVKVSAIKIAAARAKQEIRQTPPDIDTIIFGSMDGPLDGSSIYCECERCLSHKAKYTRTGMAVRFINALADELKDCVNGREIKVALLAYGKYCRAPLKDGKLAHPTVKPRKNVYVNIAPYFGDFYYPYCHEKQDLQLRNLFEEWKIVHDSFFLWGYTCANNSALNNSLFYFDNKWMWQENLNYLKQIGVKNLYFESMLQSTHQFQPKFECYVLSKMLWNPNCDIEAVRSDYILIYFGPAASYVKQAIDRFNSHYAAEVQHNGLNYRQDCQRVRLDVKYHPLQFLQSQIEILNDGIAAIETDLSLTECQKKQYIHRVKELRIQPKYMILCNYDLYFPKCEEAPKAYIADYKVRDNGRKAYMKEVFDECREIGLDEVCGYWSMDALEAYFKSEFKYGDAHRYFGKRGG